MFFHQFIEKSDLFYSVYSTHVSVCISWFMAVIYKQLIVIEIIFTANRRLGVLWIFTVANLYNQLPKKIVRHNIIEKYLEMGRFSPAIEMQK